MWTLRNMVPSLVFSCMGLLIVESEEKPDISESHRNDSKLIVHMALSL